MDIYIPHKNDILSGSIEDYPGGIVFVIDKPYRWTSADVIRKVKYAACRHFGKKNLKVGHAGTLDPLATGVLLVCIGNATKLAEEFQRHDKEYLAGITFGATTPSFDLEKDIDARFPYGHITRENVENALTGFVGEQDQVAPLFSAKSIDGVRAYEMARKAFKAGLPIPDDIIRASRIRIDSCKLEEFSEAVCQPGEAVPEDCATLGIIRGGTARGGAEQSEASDGTASPGDKSPAKTASSRINVASDDLSLPHASVRIACSKGTYIRSFARDLGEALGSGAFLNALCRTATGSFTINDALTVDEAVAILQS